MTGVVPLIPRIKFTLTSGVPAALGWVTVYRAGTTTLTNSWQDKAQTTLNTNPIHLDANGECLLWLDSAQTYKLLLQDASLVTVSGWPVDNIPGGADTAAAATAAAAAAQPYVTAAASSATDSATSAAASATARDAAQAAQRIYATAAAGDAATTTGQYYYVVSSSSANTLELWLHSGSGGTDTGKRFLSPNGLAAIANDFDRKLIGARNVFDQSAATADGTYIVATTGATGSSAGFYATDYMPVIPGGSIVSSKASFASGSNGLAFYDANKTYVSGSAVALSAGVSISVPAGAYYVRISYTTASTPKATLMVMDSTTLPAYYQAFGDPAFYPWYEKANKVAAAGRQSRFNLFDSLQVTASTAIVFADGTAGVAVGYVSSNYMPVVPAVDMKVYPASNSIVSPYGMAWYDQDKVFLSGTAGPWTSGQTFTPPANAAYCRFTVNNSTLTTFMLIPASVTAGTIMDQTAAKVSDFKQWNNKQVMQLGDSIAANTNWMSTVVTYLGMASVTNNSLSGRTMVDALKTPAGAALVSGDFTSIDVAHLHLGTNDFGGNTTMGTIADSTATASFYGRTKLAIETMLGYKPTLRIVIATLLQRTGGTTPNGGGWTLNDYSTALRNVADLYGLAINDLAKTSGINSVTIATYLSDGLHPNATGYTAGLINPSKGFFDGIWPTT